MCKGLGGDTARTAEPNWPKEYLILNSIILSSETERSWLSASNCTLYCLFLLWMFLFCLGFFCLFGFFYWCCSFVCIVAVCCFFLNELPLPQLTNFLTFLLILWREVSKQLCGTLLPTGVKPQLQDSWHSRSICRVPTNNLKLCYSQHYLNWCAF